MVISCLAIVGFALIMPFTPIGPLFGFVQPPTAFLVILAGLVGAYLVLAQIVKNWFYRRYAYRLEQVLMPKRRTMYVSRTARLVQNMVAVISLRSEDEIPIDILIEDLSLTVTYPIDPDQVAKNLQHLRRTGLISVDWHRRTIKRKKALEEYVLKNVLAGEMWPTIAQDWRKLSKAIKDKYGTLNTDYQEL